MAMAGQTLSVHVRLPKRLRHVPFGLHVYGAAALEQTSWDAPLEAAATDGFGLIFEVALAFAEKDGKMALGLILHNGDDKKSSVELTWAELARFAVKGVIYMGHGPCSEKCPAQVPEGDLHELGARGHWVSPSLLLWRTAADLPANARVTLHAKDVKETKDGLTSGEEFLLEPTLVEGEDAKVFQENPYLEGCGCLKVPPEAAARAAELCKQQLAVCVAAEEGVFDCSGVQVGALLDALFAYDGPLGCQVSDGVELRLWAPTALSVEVMLYDKPRKDAGTSHPMSLQGEGVWLLQGPKKWLGKYYTYKVQAYHPTTGRVEVMETPDPYCSACSADAGRSLICELPPMPQQPAMPPFRHRAKATIYELHVRDFSARDSSVDKAVRGKYLAFEKQGSHGDRHLRKLAAAGLSHVHLLPTFDFGSVPERAEDRKEPELPLKAGPDSEGQQLAVMELADQDAFNWGYDPVLYGVPEGSYATDPDGLARVLEHRRMVTALHGKGLRVIADVVFNHVFGGGPVGPHSILDKCVPGYYLRRSEDGRVENSTCMNNTATERYMMERHVVDMVLRWATEHRMDGFRFDLMGHLTLRCIQKCRAALDALSLEQHGIDGPRLLLYGEGWEFGEIAQGARGDTACQRLLAGTGIASFNDNLREALLGGNAFEDPRLQGFATGLGLRPGFEVAGDAEELLRISADNIRVCMAAGLTDYKLEQDCFGRRGLPACQLHGGRAAYVSAPEEVINFVCVHDNETLYDSTVWKMPVSNTSPEERVRANWLCTAFLAFGHGVPLFHAGDELLRSKSLDRDSYNSGDWFNQLDFTGQQSGFGIGLPCWNKNGTKWELMRPLLKDASLRPSCDQVAASTAKFCELLAVRKSTALLGLTEAVDIIEKVKFPPSEPGVIIMEVKNGPSAADGQAQICSKYARVVVVLSALSQELRVMPPASATEGMLRLHPLHASSSDELTRMAYADEETEELVVPAMTAVAFVEPLPGQEGHKAKKRKLAFAPSLRDRPIVGDGLGLLKVDEACVPFKAHFEYRWKVYTDLRQSIKETAGSLTDFATGYTRLGFTKDDTGAITYREWLPPAQSVSLVGDFNQWNEAATPMVRDAFGTWEVTLPAGAIAHRSKVKFCATKDDGSKVYRVPAWIKWSCPDLGKFGSTYDGYYWDPPGDGEDLRFPGFQAPRPPVPRTLRIYEAHVGMSSIEPKVNSYAEFAEEVLPRIKEAGYNCIQLMAIMEHSYYGSFGYHVTSPFAVSSRSGTPDEFKALVEQAHAMGMLVLIDLVHSHVSSNQDDGLNGMDFGQAECDNYFMSGERGYHRLWDSRLYCYKNYEVLRYLLSNLRWWLEEYNCDGFRFDGVTSMLYHHHGLYMSFTGNYEEYFGLQTDVDAVVYLMLASELVRSVLPDAVMIAEDVSGMPGLCRPVAEGGIGFDYRLAMSLPDMWISLLKDVKDEHWGMNQIVSAMCNRRRGQEKTIAYAESHDQSIVGDKTIAFWLMDAEMYTGMGDDGTPGTVVIERGMSLHRLIRAITIGLGGEGYLNFMGNEFGHPEWVDFPREGNSWCFAHCRRRFDLADSGLLRYRFLLKWDVALHALEEASGFASDEHLLVSSQHE
ncbi:unnamed protein product, partial [Effrenium voratum]